MGYTGLVLDKESRLFIREHAVIGDILNLEVASVNHEKAKIILKVPAYYLSFSPFYYQTQ